MQIKQVMALALVITRASLCSGFRGRNILPLLEVLPRPYATEGSCYPEPKPEEDEAPIARFADFVLRNHLDRKVG